MKRLPILYIALVSFFWFTFFSALLANQFTLAGIALIGAISTHYYRGALTGRN